jgi:hypothetical protein
MLALAIVAGVTYPPICIFPILYCSSTIVSRATTTNRAYIAPVLGLFQITFTANKAFDFFFRLLQLFFRLFYSHLFITSFG